jgi:TNF receptor-associated protein 1
LCSVVFIHGSVQAEGVSRGTKVVIHLKDTCTEFAQSARVKEIVEKYSNFVNYPIFLDGKQVRSVERDSFSIMKSA